MSASTASSAGRLLWMSEMIATRMGGILADRSAGGAPAGRYARRVQARASSGASRSAVQRKPLEHLIGDPACVAERAVQKEEGPVAEHRRVDVVDRPPSSLDGDVVHGRVEEGRGRVGSVRQRL